MQNQTFDSDGMQFKILEIESIQQTERDYSKYQKLEQIREFNDNTLSDFEIKERENHSEKNSSFIYPIDHREIKLEYKNDFCEIINMKQKRANSSFQKSKTKIKKNEMKMQSDKDSSDNDTNHSKNQHISCIKNEAYKNIPIQTSFNQKSINDIILNLNKIQKENSTIQSLFDQKLLNINVLKEKKNVYERVLKNSRIKDTYTILKKELQEEQQIQAIPIIVQLSLDLQQEMQNFDVFENSLNSDEKATVQGANIVIVPYKTLAEEIYLQVIKYGVKALMITGEKMLSFYDQQKDDLESSDEDLSLILQKQNDIDNTITHNYNFIEQISFDKSDNTFEQHNKKNQLMRIKNSDRKNKLKKKNTPRSKSDILKELQSFNLKYSLIIVCSARINFSMEQNDQYFMDVLKDLHSKNLLKRFIVDQAEKFKSYKSYENLKNLKTYYPNSLQLWIQNVNNNHIKKQIIDSLKFGHDCNDQEEQEEIDIQMNDQTQKFQKISQNQFRKQHQNLNQQESFLPKGFGFQKKNFKESNMDWKNNFDGNRMSKKNSINVPIPLMNQKYEVVPIDDDFMNLSQSQNYRILELIKKMNGQRVVIYCWKKIRTQQLSNFINEHLKNQCLYFNSDLNIKQRQNVIKKWEKGEIKILVRTNNIAQDVYLWQQKSKLIIHDQTPRSIKEFIQDCQAADNDFKSVMFYPKNDHRRLINLFEFDFKCNRISLEEKEEKIFLVKQICYFATDEENCRQAMLKIIQENQRCDDCDNCCRRQFK